MNQDSSNIVDGTVELDPERDMISSNSLPPYNIISSCKTIGFSKPLDCLWTEMAAETDVEEVTCRCAEYRQIGSQWSSLRQSAPIQVFLHRCLFNDPTGSSIYRMGQCPACHTIYWATESKLKVA